MATNYTENQDLLKKRYEQEINSAQAIRDNTIAENNAAMQDSLQAADILNQRLAKYIPMSNRAQGITGGLSESTALKANTAVQNMYANLNRENAYYNRQAENNYQQSVADYYGAYTRELPTAVASDKAAQDEAESALYQEYSNFIAGIEQNPNLSDETRAALREKTNKDYEGKLGAYQKYVDAANYYNMSEEEAQKILGANKSKVEPVSRNDTQASELSNAFAGDGTEIGSINSASDVYNLFSNAPVIGQNKGGKQDDYVNALIKDLKDGNVPDGSIINFNYGATSSMSSVFMYKDGKLYKYNGSWQNLEEINNKYGGVYYPKTYTMESGEIKLK